MFFLRNKYLLSLDSPHEDARMGRIKRADLEADEQRRKAPTLGDLVKEGVDVFCWCNRCAHNTIVPIASLLGQLGPALPAPEIGVHIHCTQCGAKDIAARPAWPQSDQIALKS